MPFSKSLCLLNILDLISVQRNIYPCDSSENNDLAEIVKEPDSNEANLILKKLLDAEDKGEHQLVLTLTDNRLGDGNFMTQSLLIIVEDINDNVPVFEVCATKKKILYSSFPYVSLVLDKNHYNCGVLC